MYENKKKHKKRSGILSQGGFGKSGKYGKIEAIKYARLNKIPFLGICYVMQMAIIEVARNKLNLNKSICFYLLKSYSSYNILNSRVNNWWTRV